MSETIIRDVGCQDRKNDDEPRNITLEIGETAECVEEENLCCSGQTKIRDPKEIKDLMNRLSRIEGQIRGIKRMVENDAYCVDVLRQVSAASSALKGFSCVMLANHIRTCVTDDILSGGDEKVDELIKTLQKMMK